MRGSSRTDEGLTTNGIESSARKQVSGQQLSLRRWFDRLTTNG